MCTWRLFDSRYPSAAPTIDCTACSCYSRLHARRAAAPVVRRRARCRTVLVCAKAIPRLDKQPVPVRPARQSGRATRSTVAGVWSSRHLAAHRSLPVAASLPPYCQRPSPAAHQSLDLVQRTARQPMQQHTTSAALHHGYAATQNARRASLQICASSPVLSFKVRPTWAAADTRRRVLLYSTPRPQRSAAVGLSRMWSESVARRRAGPNAVGAHI